MPMPSLLRRSASILLVVAMAGCTAAPASTPPSSSIQPSSPTSGPSPAPSIGPTASPIAPTPVVPTPSTTPTPAPTAPPKVGTEWTLVEDPDLSSWPSMGQLSGVIAGGPGAIAWGELWGKPAANGGLPHLGPRIWTTANGRDWVAAAVDPIPGADSSLAGAVLDVAPLAKGFIAVGRYLRDRAGFTTAIWTSADGRSWTLDPAQPVFDHRLVEQVVAWKGGLLAFGCELASGTDCGPPRIWTSPDGVAWTMATLVLPSGIAWLGQVEAGPDRLWRAASTSEDGELTMPGAPQPTWLTSTDGGTWITSALAFLGGGRLHPLPGGVFFTAAETPSGEGDFEGIPEWMERAPGIYRETGDAWEPVATGSQLGEEVVQVGDTYLMVGTTGSKCWWPKNCVAAAWRSTDRGTTWGSVPVTGTPPTPGATIRYVAALPDGTLVAVGWLAGSDGTPYTGAWVSPPMTAS